jgi:hypothetical protein
MKIIQRTLKSLYDYKIKLEIKEKISETFINTIYISL